MIPLAAGLAGLGGLLLQLTLVRRHGLLLGNTAEAAALVLALFLLGLGIGGLVGPRWRWVQRRPLGAAALLYGLVSLLAVATDAVLQSLPPLPVWGGAVTALLSPGLPTFCMGAAFPLLFSALPRHAAPIWGGLLVAFNLAGAVAGTFWGGNFGIPGLGLDAVTKIAALAYGVAALLLAVRSRFQRTVEPPVTKIPLPAPGPGELCVFVAGFLLLGLEVYMLRRLPFFLDGFQPTLAGVVTACLVGLTLGAALGTPLLLRWSGAAAGAMSVVLAAVTLALGSHEWLARDLGRMAVDSDLGFHGRILLSAFAAAGLPCFFLGATIPVCLAACEHPETRARLAGRLFFCEGVGALCGALFVGHLLPALWPGGFFALALPATTVVAVLLLAGHRPQVAWPAIALLILCSALGLGGAGSPWRPQPPVVGSRYDRPQSYRYLEHATDSVLTASVAYDRAEHRMILFTDEFRAAYTGADTGYMKVLGHLPFLLRGELEHIAVIALGTGTTANAVVEWPGAKQIDVVEISRSVVSMVDHFAGAGPARSADKRARFLRDPRTRLHVTDGRRFVARADTGSLDLISMEPLLPYAPGTVPLYTREFYQLCNRALSQRGLMVQWVPTHAMPEEFYRTLLRTFAEGFDHKSVWLFDQSTLLVGSKQPHLPKDEELRQRLNTSPRTARRQLHEAGVAAATDLYLALVWRGNSGFQRGQVLTDDRPFLERIGYWSASRRLGFYSTNLKVLQAKAAAGGDWPAPKPWSRLREERLGALIDLHQGRPLDALELFGRLRTAVPRSVLLHEEERRTRRRLRRLQIAQDRCSIAVAERHLLRDPGCVAVHGFLAGKAQDQKRRSQARAAAMALNPLFFGESEPGVLEALSTLPSGEALASLAAAPDARGLAIRAKYRVPVAWALVEILRRRPLTATERSALLSILDPMLMLACARPIQDRGGSLTEELLPLWRQDLPMPPALRTLLKAPVQERRRLAVALGRRRSGPALLLLADLMVDPEEAVRTAAGVSLFTSLGDRVKYDPLWPESLRREAATKVRNLHNPHR